MKPEQQVLSWLGKYMEWPMQAAITLRPRSDTGQTQSVYFSLTQSPTWFWQLSQGVGCFNVGISPPYCVVLWPRWKQTKRHMKQKDPRIVIPHMTLSPHTTHCQTGQGTETQLHGRMGKCEEKMECRILMVTHISVLNFPSLFLLHLGCQQRGN